MFYMGIFIIKEKELNKKNIFNVYILIFVLSGIIGFIYEEIFYYFDLGYLVKRGSTFGPWIPIYAFGGLFITLFTYKFKKNPLVVFLISLIVTTFIEYVTGYVLHKFFDIRLWNYSEEILNFGNIQGYICLRSVLLFAFAGLFLIYKIIPFLIKIVKDYSKSSLNTICLILLLLFIIDMILFSVLK